MKFFRLAQSLYARDLSGRGAQLGGGRWNSPGTALVYTAESRALAAVEIAVNSPLGILPQDYVLIELVYPDSLPLLQISIAELPKDWNAYPYSQVTQFIGDQFTRELAYACCQVPSVAVAGDFNYLFNPLHPDFRFLELQSLTPFHFDKRMFIR